MINARKKEAILFLFFSFFAYFHIQVLGHEVDLFQLFKLLFETDLIDFRINMKF